MSEEERIVGVVSPWEKLSALIKEGFRIQTLPREKMVMVWREDLTTEKALLDTIRKAGITSVEARKKRVVAKWEE